MNFTPHQRAAIETTGKHLCVDAGAGSGKTSVLVQRILHLLDTGVPLRQIVAITFTRKAASEMRERLRKAIHAAPDPNDPKSMTKWRELEYQVESARITTIDSFCAGLLRENALQLGIDPNFAMLADAESALLRADVAARAVEELLENGDEAAHRLAAEHGAFQLIAFMERELANPARLQGVAATYASFDADQLIEHWSEKTETILGERYAPLARDPRIAEWIAGLEALGGHCSDASDGREVVRLTALDALRQIMADSSVASITAALQSLAALDFRKGSAKRWDPAESFAKAKEIAEQARALARKMLIGDADPVVDRIAATLTLDLLHVYRNVIGAYDGAKTARTALDFSDLLTKTAEMLASHGDLRERTARGIRHLLIDEFQDTNQAQLDMALALSSLAAETGAELFVVGDAKQSIYRFRSAEVEVFDEARRRADETLFLDENFRSVPEVIAFVNDFFTRSKLLCNVEPEFHRLNAKRDAAGGPCVEFLVPEPQTDDNDKDATVDVYREAEARLIASRIAEMCGENGIDVFDKASGKMRRAQFGDIALLFRTGSNIDTYDAALRNAGVPSVVLEGSGFYARQEILDMHNLFAAALDPWNEFALAAFLRGPLGGLSDDTLMELTRERGLAEAFAGTTQPASADEARRLDAARALLKSIWSNRELPLPRLVREVLNRTGFEAILLPQIHGVQKAGNLRKLVDLAESFSRTGRASLHSFTAYLATVARRELREGDADLVSDASGAVTLMTIHKAKGLEFPIAIIADAGAQKGGHRGPSLCHAHRKHGLAAVFHDEQGATATPQFAELLQRVDGDEEDDEESRVLYVAATRARDRLLIGMSPKRTKGTWAAAIDDTLHVIDQPDGATIEGDGWAGRVFRTPRRVTARRALKRADEAFDLPTLRRRAERLDAERLDPASVPVSQVLDRIFATEPEALPPVPGPSARLDVQTLGNAAHALLERWDFAKAPPFKGIIREFCPRASLHTELATALESIAEKFRNSPIWPLVSEARSLERELPFTWRRDGVIIRGTIDLLIDGDRIVDYKTGRRHKERHGRYEGQLQLYAAAAASAGRPVERAQVLYLDTGELCDVDVSAEAITRAEQAVREALKRPA